MYNPNEPLADDTFRIEFTNEKGVKYVWESITWRSLVINLETCLLLNDTITHISKNEA